MSLSRGKKAELGFTLLEITIVMAIVGLLTISILTGSGNATREERFSGGIRQIKANIRDAQTKAYTVKTGNGCAISDAGPGGGNVCYWRGNVLTFNVGGPDTSYALNLLYGADLSAANGFTNPRNNLFGMTPTALATYALDSIQISSINLGGAVAANGAVSGGQNVSSVSVAFLAPDGHAYSCDTTHNGAGCTPSKATNPSPYADSGDINISFSDAASSHTAVVTIRPSDGTISSINL
jgi:prepilin-type N-terminal cleavage/methylation domain-containing protein